MKPHSKDLRVKVLAAVDRGIQEKGVAPIFGVSEPTIRRYYPSYVRRPAMTSNPSR
jgi:transposase